MKIVSLQAENVKRLRAVEIRPDGSLVVIKGQNGAGKSSVLDSIWMALGGAKAIPSRPVREGKKKAVVRLELTDLVVTRTISADGSSTLKVEGKDGAKFGSPQTMLDKLVANLSFDPLAFSRMKPREQRETLRQLVGLDFSELDATRAKRFEERTEVNREVKRLEGELSGVEADDGAPAEEISMGELVVELRQAEAVQGRVQAAKTAAAQHESAAAAARAEVEELRKRATALKQRAEEADQKAANARAEAETIASTAPSIDALRERLANADKVNARVRAATKYRTLAAKLAEQKKASATLTRHLETLDQSKAEKLQAASFPLEGLGLGDDGVTMKGLPFEQASSAEQLRASVAIGLALNPKLRVLLVRDGSLLDEESLRLVAEMAASKDAQVWCERVGTHDAIGILIEDGAVAGSDFGLADVGELGGAANDQTAVELATVLTLGDDDKGGLTW